MPKRFEVTGIIATGDIVCFRRKSKTKSKSPPILTYVNSLSKKLENSVLIIVIAYILDTKNNIGELGAFFKNSTGDKLKTLRIKKNIEKISEIFQNIKLEKSALEILTTKQRFYNCKFGIRGKV